MSTQQFERLHLDVAFLLRVLSSVFLQRYFAILFFLLLLSHTFTHRKIHILFTIDHLFCINRLTGLTHSYDAIFRFWV